LLGVTIIPKKVTDFLRSTIYETVLTREKEDVVRPDMLQLLTQAMKGTLTDETSSEDGKKTDKSNGMWIFLCWDQNTNHLRVIHDIYITGVEQNNGNIIGTTNIMFLDIIHRHIFFFV
jgi:hypothetical protein